MLALVIFRGGKCEHVTDAVPWHIHCMCLMCRCRWHCYGRGTSQTPVMTAVKPTKNLKQSMSHYD